MKTPTPVEYVPTIRFTAAERAALLWLARHALIHMDLNQHLAAVQSAYGRLLSGDFMTKAERETLLPPRWYVSKTGRKLLSRDDDEVPITPKQLNMLETSAIRARGEAVTKTQRS